MNSQISISVLIAFSLTFFSLFVFSNSIFSDPFTISRDNSFFVQTFDPEEKKIFLFGSSHVAIVNTTHIIQLVSNNDNEYTVYNLAYDNDNPQIREETLQQVISLKPEIIFYGISFQDFQSKPKKENQIPSLIQVIGEKVDLFPTNPKRNTLHMIRNLLNDTNVFSSPIKDISPENSPFVTFQNERTIIVDDNELKRKILTSSFEISISPVSENVQVDHLHRIIMELQKNNIRVIIFKTPLHQYYLDSIKESEKIAFDSIIDNISKEFNIKVYDFSKKYIGESIWHDPSHIAYNDKSIVYSEDIAKMIISEISK